MVARRRMYDTLLGGRFAMCAAQEFGATIRNGGAGPGRRGWRLAATPRADPRTGIRDEGVAAPPK